MMGFAVIHQREVSRTVREHLVIQFQAGNATANPGMIFNGHLVPARVVTKYDFEISPRSGHAGIEPRSRIYQIANVRSADLLVDFVPNETICTETCQKFRPEQPREMARQAGFRLAAQWLDAEWPFAENLLVAV